MYFEDFRRVLQKVGFKFHYVIKDRPFAIKDNENIKELCGPIKFSSKTIRAFKIDELEDRHENYG